MKTRAWKAPGPRDEYWGVAKIKHLTGYSYGCKTEEEAIDKAIKEVKKKALEAYIDSVDTHGNIPIRERDDCNLIVYGIDTDGFLLYLPKKGSTVPEDFLVHHYVFYSGKKTPVFWHPSQVRLGS